MKDMNHYTQHDAPCAVVYTHTHRAYFPRVQVSLRACKYHTCRYECVCMYYLPICMIVMVAAVVVHVEIPSFCVPASAAAAAAAVFEREKNQVSLLQRFFSRRFQGEKEY